MTHRKLLILALGFIIAVGLTACDDLIDVDPEQSISSDQAFEALQNAEAALNGVYDQLQSSDVYGGHMTTAGDFTAGTAQFSGSFTTWQATRGFNKTSDHGPSENMWEGHYELINRANNVIAFTDGLDEVDDAATEDDVNRLVGQARFLRALGYFNLVRLYAHPVGDLGQEAFSDVREEGVPLVTEPTEEVGEELEVPRSTVQEVYGQIAEDLETAESLLGPVDRDGIRANELSATALLAKVRLYQEQWGEARDLAEEVINSGSFQLSSDPLAPFTQGAGNSELIFAVRNTADDNSGVNAFPTSFYLPDALGGRGEMEVVEDFAAQFEEGDLRGFGGETAPEGDFLMYELADNLHPNKWTSDVNSDDIPVLRLAEMYLIAAEAHVRAGDGDEATAREYLNTVRERAGASSVPGTLSGTALLDEIIDERKRELAFEGDQYFDVVRLGRDLVSSFEGTETEASEVQRIYPIPAREMDVNQQLVQNPGY